ncbi:hypothetical protein BSLG_000979 [Batrachochytrium salamandrivorans]|nr:hypothetical protein BSLG_000979 [Batrachochytrium salamandrivorans]
MSKSLAAVFGKNNVCSLAVFLSARWDDGLQPQPSTVDHSGSGTTVVSASRPIDSTLPILRPSDPPALVSLLLDTLVGVASLSTKLNQPIPEHRLPGYNRSQSELINRQIEHILQSRKSTKNVLALGYRQVQFMVRRFDLVYLPSKYPCMADTSGKGRLWLIWTYSARLNLPAFSIHESSKIALLEKPPDCPKDSTRDTILSSGESHLVSKKREFSSIDTHEYILCLLERDSKVLLHELSRSIFPLQYHLTSPLTEAKVSGENWLKRRNYGGATIPTKRPRRIMALNSLLEKVILLCKKCNYHALLDHYCPLPQVRSVKKSINRMLDLSIEHQKVSLFIKSVLKHIIPKDLWGDDSNRDVILAVVSQLVSLRRYETLSLQNIITGIKTNFYATDTAPYKNRVFYFRHEMWGRVGQYLQESARASLLEPIDMTDMANVLADAGGQRALGFSSIRFLPKEVGARTIMNLGRKPNVKEMEYIGLSPNQIKRLLCFRNKGANMLSINQLLQNAHHVLSFEKTHRPTLINNAVMGLNDIYLKFKAYKMGLVEAHIGGKIPQLYCCKMDIASCFDTIQHDKLLSILETFLSKTDYVIQKYATLYASGERVRRGFHKRARDAADFQKFSELVEESSAIVNHTVFTDQVEYQIEAANSIRDLLISHIKGNYVKIGKKFYRQKVGIPQGSILSTILCRVDLCIYATLIWGSLFYAHFENLYLADLLLNDSGTLLMRFPWCGVAIDLHRLEIKSVSFQSRSIFNIADSLTMDISRTPGQHLKEKLFHYLKAKFHPIYLDTSLNSVCGVLSNIYENFCSAAMRLCSYMRISFEGKIDRNLGFIIEIIEKAVCFGAQIMHSRMRSNPMLQNKCEFRVASKEIQSLGLKAFIFVLGRRKERFGQLLPPLRKLLVLIGISKPRERLHARIHAKSRRDAPKVVY